MCARCRQTGEAQRIDLERLEFERTRFQRRVAGVTNGALSPRDVNGGSSPSDRKLAVPGSARKKSVRFSAVKAAAAATPRSKQPVRLPIAATPHTKALLGEAFGARGIDTSPSRLEEEGGGCGGGALASLLAAVSVGDDE